ncbi:muscle M-line assembly protein unc-89 [Drosophila pseudoobscura]|uniref:Muscle M-line assembly protein unc-89 n=1 Tax=Drosophila pseudoobscura pseudoobscura TaxID=46245 RepID=A0A6I8USI4_DROPS|nr:muscle M-line assembly protein unc-89 [Drosophila pseudoobscura]
MSADEGKAKPSVYEHLMHHSIKRQFEQNGTMSALRSGVHVKVLKMIKTNLGGSKDEPLAGPGVALGHDSFKENGLSSLINQLMMEYFEWFGYRHTMETFKMETGEKILPRQEIEGRLVGKFQLKDVPILVQLVLRNQDSPPKKNLKVTPKKIVKLPLPVAKKTMKRQLPEKAMRHLIPEKSVKQQLSEKSVKQKLPEKSGKPKLAEKPVKQQLPDKSGKQQLPEISGRKIQLPEISGRRLQLPENSIPERCPKLKEKLETLRTLKETAKTDWNIPVSKLVQNNRKLTQGQIKKPDTVVKTQMKENPKAYFATPRKETPESRPPVNSSESDELPSYDEHSDASSDIPDRHYYVEEEPPEVSYAPGHGEEGPYIDKQNKAETLYQQYQDEKPIDTSKGMNKQKSIASKHPPSKKSALTTIKKSAIKSKAFDVPEFIVTMPSRNKASDGLDLNKLMSCKNRSPGQSTPGRSPLWNKMPVEGDEPSLAVTKPQCPETHINGIDLDSSSENNESSDEDAAGDGYHNDDDNTSSDEDD